MSVFDPNGPIFCHFSNAAAASGCCSRNRVNSSDSSPGLGKYRSRASRLSISRSTRYLPSRVPRSPFRRWVSTRKGERRCDLFGEIPLILLRLDSWLQLDSVQAEHLWHGKSSPLPSNHLCRMLLVATRSGQEGSKGGNSKSRSARQSSSHARGSTYDSSGARRWV